MVLAQTVGERRGTGTLTLCRPLRGSIQCFCVGGCVSLEYDDCIGPDKWTLIMPTGPECH